MVKECTKEVNPPSFEEVYEWFYKYHSLGLRIPTVGGKSNIEVIPSPERMNQGTKYLEVRGNNVTSYRFTKSV